MERNDNGLAKYSYLLAAALITALLSIGLSLSRYSSASSSGWESFPLSLEHILHTQHQHLLSVS
jgi:hypothetical protein